MKYKPGIFERVEEKLSKAKGRVLAPLGRHYPTRMILNVFSFVGRIIHKTIMLVVNNAALTVVYFVGIGITFLIAKILKKDLGFRSEEESSWKRFELKELKSYMRQF